ncbi:MAG: hypothetical protein R6V44_12855 [Paracoccaceae bacterium]
MIGAEALARIKDRAAGPPSLRGPGALLLLALCFAGSAIARAADPDGALVAAAVDRASIATPSGACPAPEPGSLLAAIREREDQLDERAGVLADRARVLEAAERRFRAEAVALEDAERRLAATLAIADEAAEDDVGRLVAVYESMKPKSAARIFESMDVVFAAGFLARMDREAAAEILAELPPERAYAVSAVIAGRNAAAPTE